MTIFDDLEAEQDRLAHILAGLDAAQWASPSAAGGWTIADVVLHLAQSEEAVVATAAGAPPTPQTPGLTNPHPPPHAPFMGLTVDEFADQAVRAERSAGSPLPRWQTARTAALAALRAADPGQPLRWVAAPLKPATLATTRLAEHWAHGLDVAGPLGVEYPDNERLRHISWLAHRTLPYAMGLAGLPAGEVACELTAPDGVDVWRFGPDGAVSVISGPAGAFCRVAAQRLAPGRSGLRGTDETAQAAIRLLRTYAA
jgi:uncharacterized protein (TIGR03084 family)